jgi:hypothetical protein
MAETQYTLDSLLQMKDAGLVAASAAATVSAAAKIIDLGAAAKIKGEVVIDITALEIASNDEYYTIGIEGSSASDFSATLEPLASLTVGAKEVIPPGSTAYDTDSTTGRYILPFTNERNGTVYRYLRLYTTVAGTIATGINYTAWLAKRK